MCRYIPPTGDVHHFTSATSPSEDPQHHGNHVSGICRRLLWPFSSTTWTTHTTAHSHFLVTLLDSHTEGAMPCGKSKFAIHAKVVRIQDCSRFSEFAQTRKQSRPSSRRYGFSEGHSKLRYCQSGIFYDIFLCRLEYA